MRHGIRWTLRGGLLALVAMGVSSLPAAGVPQPVAAASDECGEAVFKADGSRWSCTFADDFDGTSLDREKWMPQVHGYETGDSRNFACYKDTPETVSVRDGHLRLRLIQGEAQPCPGLKDRVTRFSAGSVSTYRLFSQKYGRFEARTRNTAASVSGLHEAFWLWPDDRSVNVTRWPASGEIDIAETYSQHPDLAVPFLHSKWDVLGPLPGFNTAWNCAAERGEWTTYRLDWTPTKIEIFVDDRLCLRASGADSAFQQPYIIAFTQGIGGAPNVFTSATPVPATYEVDYIRVWS